MLIQKINIILFTSMCTIPLVLVVRGGLSKTDIENLELS
jgi:hypothetical protein